MFVAFPFSARFPRDWVFIGLWLMAPPIPKPMTFDSLFHDPCAQSEDTADSSALSARAPVAGQKSRRTLCNDVFALIFAVTVSGVSAAETHYPLRSVGGNAVSSVPEGTWDHNAVVGDHQPASSLQRSNRRPAQQSLVFSQDVHAVLDWVLQSGNNAQRPFVLVDKRSAAAHVFDAAGVLQASTAVLLGLARGDHSVPGIGERPISQIAPHERTTPAGRFVSEPGHNLQGEDIVWIDYDDAVSLHRVRPKNNPAERRAQRLASRTVADNRISFGCVNLPSSFYDRYIAPGLGKQTGVIYVLPETQPVAEFFGFKPSTVHR